MRGIHSFVVEEDRWTLQVFHCKSEATNCILRFGPRIRCRNQIHYRIGEQAVRLVASLEGLHQCIRVWLAFRMTL